MKVGIVCCSNGQPVTWKSEEKRLTKAFMSIGITPVYSDHIYERDTVFSGTGKERAECLMQFYRDPEISAIYDISGGDIANEVLPYLDFNIIKNSGKKFWGYSDLTTIINAIYTMTGESSVLYQVRNLIGSKHYAQISLKNKMEKQNSIISDITENQCGKLIANASDHQLRDFSQSFLDGKNDLFDFPYSFIQGESMEGVVIGGNIRCFLKLAGTPYWPDVEGKILLLESLSGKETKISTCLNQLSQIGVFKKISGLLLGSFTEMDACGLREELLKMVKTYVDESVPIAETRKIGHGEDSKAIMIGEKLSLTKE